jgi:hypothetical protein
MIGYAVCLVGTIAFIASGFWWPLFLFIPLGSVLVLLHFGHAIWDLAQTPLARRREAARAKDRE